MKKLYLISVVVLVLVACQKTELPYSEQQNSFISFLVSQENTYQQLGNEILKKEFITSHKRELYNYMDSSKVLVNWFGFINDINTKESGESTAVEFTLSFPLDSSRESWSKKDCILFYCSHLVKTDSLRYDVIYNKVKHIPEGFSIYFDGIIRMKNNCEIYYHDNYLSTTYSLPSPHYDFWVLNLKEESNPISSNLQNAINNCYEITEPLRLNYLGKITKEKSDSIHVALLPKFNTAKENLTNEEKQYIGRLGTDLVYNFLYGD